MVPPSSVDEPSQSSDSLDSSTTDVFFPPEQEAALEEDDESSQLAHEDLPPIITFDELPVGEEVLQGIKSMGWSTPTEVQSLCLPYALKGQDVAGFAQTGTGKTGVFLITLAAQLLRQKQDQDTSKPRPPSAVILAPTRELALQIFEDSEKLFRSLKLRSTLIFGGVDFEKQLLELKKSPQVLVATPGRLKDFVQRKAVSLKSISIFVCDEVDRMFDIGFIEDVEYFLAQVPDTAQKLMFSATSNDTLEELCFEYLNRPKFLSVSQDEITPERITQKAILCSVSHKLRVFIGLLRSHKPQRAIIFTNTKMTAAWLHYKLSHNDFETDLITGDLPQKKRISLIRRIKAGKIRYLIATDVASRGLHISGITHVYNFDLPTEPANYIHRIGRTARAGATGTSYSLVCDEYGSHLVGINELMKTPVLCEWFPEEYLAIKDNAPDPFLNNFGKAHRGRSESARSPSRSAGHHSKAHLQQERKGASRRPAAQERKGSTYSSQRHRTSSSAKAGQNARNQQGPTRKQTWDKKAQRASQKNFGSDRGKGRRPSSQKPIKPALSEAKKEKKSWLGVVKKKIKDLVS